MKKKIGNNLLVLIIIFIFITSFVIYIKPKTYIYIYVLLIVAIVILLRILSVLKERIFEYLCSPKRFCKGKGVEIGSGGLHNIKGSLLVDIITDFSTKTIYNVDYIADAHELPKINDASMDYVCSSNVLEHLTNPIKAILEWMRILKPGGIIWLKIPDKRKTFDKNRARTKLDHLIIDYKNGVPFDDPTHVDDHNNNSVPPRKEKHPYVHNHVWILEDIIELFNYINKKYVPLNIACYNENKCKNAQDFWIVVKKL